MMKICIIEPCYFGLGYLKAAQQLDFECVVLTCDPQNPDRHGYRDLVGKIIVCSVTDVEKMHAALIDAACLKQIKAVVAGNQFVTVAAAQLANTIGTIGVRESAALCGVHKDLARTAYQKVGAPSPQFALVSTLSEAREAAKRIGTPFIIKPTSAASSKGVTLVESYDDLERAYTALDQMNFGMFGFEHRSQYLIEEYVDGSEYSVELAFANGALKFAGITEKWVTKPPHFVELGHVFPARVSSDQEAMLKQAAIEAVDALGLEHGVFHVELKLSDKGPRIIETNPRPGGDHITTDLVPIATGVNLFELHLKVLLSQTLTSSSAIMRGAAVGFVVADRPGTFLEIEGWENLKKEKEVVRFALEKTVGDIIRPPESSADRIAYLIVEGEDADHAATCLHRILKDLTVRYVE